MSNYFENVLSHIANRPAILNTSFKPDEYETIIRANDGYLPTYDSGYTGPDTFCALIDEDRVQRIKVCVNKTKLRKRVEVITKHGERHAAADDCVEVIFFDQNGQEVVPRYHTKMEVKTNATEPDCICITTWDDHNKLDCWKFVLQVPGLQ